MSSSTYESLPPERQTMTLSPSSIMLKSLMARPVSRIRRLVSLLASKRSRFKRSASSALGGCDSGAVTGSACMGVLDEVLSTAALQLDADRGAVGKCQRLADADADLPEIGRASCRERGEITVGAATSRRKPSEPI